jgi:hypothetical protein
MLITVRMCRQAETIEKGGQPSNSNEEGMGRKFVVIGNDDDGLTMAMID